jgi:hypothetical protein
VKRLGAIVQCTRASAVTGPAISMETISSSRAWPRLAGEGRCATMAR